jgi:hypothetical protein
MRLLPHDLTRHLSEHELQPPDPECAFCASRSRLPVAVLQTNPEVCLLKCSVCHAASASRYPVAAALDRYYRDDFYPHTGKSSHRGRVTFDSARSFGRRLAPRVTQYVERRSLTILDFGGGDGTLAIEVARSLLGAGAERVSIRVVDYCKTPREPSDPRISIEHFESLDQLPRGEYELVLASAVLEHLTQPAEALRRLLGLGTPGGSVFYARTPYVLPFMKLFGLVGLQWDFLYPAHLHDLGQEFWDGFRCEGWEMVASQPSLVESSLRDHLLTAVAAHLFKAPWYVLGKRYGLVGGWEVVMRRTPP